MDRKKLSGVKSLSHLFTFILVVLIAGIGGALFFAFKTLPAYATTVNQKLAQANLITPTPGVVSESTLKLRAGKYFVDTQLLQTQITKDVHAYAEQLEIPIGDIAVNSNTSTAAITIQSDIPYNTLMQFLSALEGNVPKITVTSLSLEKVNGTSNVTVKSLTIAVATR